MASRSPRRPLAELDQSQVSQRLFHSPSLASPASVSPSLLLTNQLPPSVERRQRNTERQLSELKAQMQELAVSTGNQSHFSQQKRMALEQERDQLEALLEEKEYQMETLKKSVEALNAEYSANLSSAQQVRYLKFLRTLDAQMKIYFGQNQLNMVLNEIT